MFHCIMKIEIPGQATQQAMACEDTKQGCINDGVQTHLRVVPASSDSCIRSCLGFSQKVFCRDWLFCCAIFVAHHVWHFTSKVVGVCCYTCAPGQQVVDGRCVFLVIYTGGRVNVQAWIAMNALYLGTQHSGTY